MALQQQNGAPFFHQCQSSAVFFNQFFETLLDPTPNYQTKHTAAVALVDPGAKSTKKKWWKENPPREKWRKNRNLNKFTTFINKYLQMQSNASFVYKKGNLQPHKDDVSESLASNCPGCQDVKNDINPCNC